MLDIDIRPYREGDEKQITSLLKLVFNGWPHFEINCSPEEFWRWKYLDNPLNSQYVMLGVDDEKIIGCHHIQPMNVKIGSEIVKGSTSGDLAVHPDYRGKGLMSTISVPNEKRAEKNGIKYSYFITSNPILVKTFTSSKDHSKRRPAFPVTIRNHVRIQNIDLQLEEMPMNNPWLVKTGWRALKTIDRISEIVSSDSERSEDIKIKQVHQFDIRIDSFWEKIKKSYDYILERKQDYLNWRYSDPRLVGYMKAVALGKNDEIQGYIVYKINRYRKRYPIGYIVDLLTQNDRLDVAEALIAKAIDYFDKESINIVNCQHTQEKSITKALEKHGFLDGRINMHVFYNQYGGYNGMNNLTDIEAKRAYMAWGDHDALPVTMPKKK